MEIGGVAADTPTYLKLRVRVSASHSIEVKISISGLFTLLLLFIFNFRILFSKMTFLYLHICPLGLVFSDSNYIE